MVDRPLFFFTVIAIIVGIIFSYSLSTYATLYYGYSEFHFFLRQLGVGVGSIVIMWYISTLDPDKFIIKLGFIIFFFFLFLMIIMHFLPDSLASSAGGAKRWIRLPGFSLSPVEFFKIGFILFLAWSFSRKFSPHQKKEPLEEFLAFLPYIGAFALFAGIIAFLQNDLGQVVLLAALLVILGLFAGTSLRFFLFMMVIALVGVFFLIVGSEHRILRVKLWWATAQNFILSLFPSDIAQKLRIEDLPEPYQIYHSFNAIKNGGIFGVGIGNGNIKLGFLSEIHTDIVLSGIAEESGFIGLLLVTTLIFLIVFRIFKIANRSQNQVYHLFALGAGVLIAFSFLINAFGISGLAPIKGLAVPFLSYGGSSLLASSVLIGMILSISKKAKM